MESAKQEPQEVLDLTEIQEPPAKRARTDDSRDAPQGSMVTTVSGAQRFREKGQALIKEEYLVDRSSKTAASQRAEIDDDAAEGRTAAPDNEGGQNTRNPKDKKGKKGKQRGQNKDRHFGSSSDTLRLCNSRAHTNEFSPRHCKWGARCNALHDIRKYLAEGRRGDLDIDSWGKKCPGMEAFGKCQSGWRCRFVKTHSEEVTREDGRKELVLLTNTEKMKDESAEKGDAENGKKENGDTKDGEDDEQWEDWLEDRAPDIHNIAPNSLKIDLQRKRLTQDKSETYLKWLSQEVKAIHEWNNRTREQREDEGEDREELRATFVDPPFKPSEKRRLYFGRETPVLAPLTTQGNLPFRRLCVELGAQGTYSEMALAQDLVHGKKSEWALMKVHESEIAPPRFNGSKSIVKDYDNARDLKFGAQIAASHPWQATKAVELMTANLPHLRLVDLNCGCPIDLVYRQGAGSGLLEQSNKIDRLVRGMNVVSGEVPITVKLRMGVKDKQPNALSNIEKICFGSFESSRLGPPGAAAITLHGRSRQQRYKHSANWEYIGECAALIKSYREKRDELTDTAREADPNTQAAAQANGTDMYFLGNGDCYSHEDYFDHVDKAGVDTVMVARGALLKPWLFEEIEKGQYLDKTATERLAYVEKFARYGMECWGTDELGIGVTRRFMLEYLSFAHRYVPVGLLDYLPPALNDRPPAFKCRNELETLLSSGNYKDWIKISEMFLGPAHQNFRFEPKHKSNAYEVEAEG